MSDEITNEETHRFVLETPFRYATKGGDQETASWIELRPPTTRHSRECAALKQAFLRASNSLEESSGTPTEIESDKKSEGPSGMGLVTVIAMSTVVDLPDVLEVARKLFSNGVAWVEGEMKLTAKLIEGMSQDDFERMLGEYLVNFTLASTLAQAKKTSSAQ